MAESVVTFLLSRVNTLLTQEANLLLGVDNKIRSIRDQYEWINSFLKDADHKRHKYERVNVWVNQIRDVAYDVEDTIDAYVFKLEQHLQRNLALRLISTPSKLKAIHTFGVQLIEIKTRLDEISANRTRYGLEYIQPGESSSTDVAPRQKRAPIVEEADVVGFEEDAKKLAKALLARESPRRAVASIVGMGGLGKTTLAKKVYNRRDVKDGFESKAWVSVSQEYSVKDLLESVAKQMMVPIMREQGKEMDEEEVKSKLFEKLRGRRYLVVVDDIWANEAWDLLEKAFPDDSNGSRIMLTTRNREVALYADPSSSPHDLHLLDKDESWKLFCKKAFPGSSCPIELEKFGEQIVGKASGLPLAIVVLGGLLSTKQQTHSVWQRIVESVDWHLIEGPNRCLQVLALSYNDLPFYLKSCFLYFGMFPEDVEIEADKLILLWTAEGFIQERGEETMEDVAEDYLEELIQRSMVQIAKRRYDGSIEACRMHDLLRDLAISEAKEGRFLEIYESHRSIESIRPRRLTSHLGKGMLDANLRKTVENTRSLLLCFQGGREGIIWFSICGGVKLLRVLDLSNVCIGILPKEIGKLIHLKYLGLHRTRLWKLPDSIGNLINLQTLDLRDTYAMVTLNMLQNLLQLRHLLCRSVYSKYPCGCYRSRHASASNRIDHLRYLQTLDVETGGWMNGGLEKLTNMRRLVIRGELRRYSKVLSDSLTNFHRLRLLELHEFSRTSPLPLVSFSHHIYLTKLALQGQLEKLPNKEDFPPNLASLYLSMSKIKESVDPMAILEKLPKLKNLVLSSYAYLGKMMTCSRGGFVNLHRLEIVLLEDLEEWIVEDGSMPNLGILEVRSCKRLKVISDSLKHISTLKEVQFSDVPEEITSWWQQPASNHHSSRSW